MIYKLTGMLALGVLAATAAAQETPDKETTAFVKTAIEGNIAEVQMGTLAGQRASAEEVVELADMIVTDHTNAIDKLTSIAEEMDVRIPRTPSSEAQTEYHSLAQLSGIAFDREFIDVMVRNHESTIEKYRSYLQETGGASEVAAYAEDTVPTLEKHLEKARALQGAAP